MSGRKEKGKALKVESESSMSEDSSKDSTDNGISLMFKKLKIMLKKEGRLRNLHRKEEKGRKTNKLEIKDILCYECKKHRHLKANCPLVKKKWSNKKKSKKSLMATWEDLNSESNISDEEVANICLMVDVESNATNIEVNSYSSSYSTNSGSDEISFETLLTNSHMIALEYKKLKEKYKALEK
uniref:CCHC-type domain-containing protein n=1 Tax=Cajanus cajan TaxID=3821 RepID=A0A151SHA7_CAJCA|nr:hypothetical protein KK1_000275 [Cajanus cajan]